jgi:hypothetical protein
MESELDTLVLKKRRARLLNPQSAPESFLVAAMFQYVPPQPFPQYNPPQEEEPPDYERRRESLAGDVADIKVDLTRALDAQALHEDKHVERIEAEATRRASSRAAGVSKARASTALEEERRQRLEHIDSKLRRSPVRRSERVAEYQAERAYAKKIYSKKEIDEMVAHNTRTKQSRDDFGSNPKGPATSEYREYE